jgi:hypothetical protein
VSIDRADQCGSNGMSYNVAVAVLTEIRSMKEHFEICKDFVFFFLGWWVGWFGLVRRGREWQWLGGSGVNRCGRSRRFEWYQFDSGSGSIGRVMIDGKSDCILKFVKILCVFFRDGGWGLDWCGGVGSGSGWVGVVPLDRSGQGGSNGISYDVAVAVLTEIRSFGNL